MEQPRGVVLVHGAWANGSSWSKVIPSFFQQGLDVVAVQLPLTSLKMTSGSHGKLCGRKTDQLYSLDTRTAER